MDNSLVTRSLKKMEMKMSILTRTNYSS
uniref:Uncharacterized protein n=1 Tax=Rhizophora mucronata TaxID=61149 RepID=A0A2P2R2T7_RHIMU